MNRKRLPADSAASANSACAGLRAPISIFLSLLALLILASSYAHADNDAQLQRLREKISALEADINSTRQHRSEAYQQLVKVERRLDRLHRQLRKLDRKLVKTRTELRNSKRSQEKLKTSIGEQHDAVVGHIRTAYLLGSQAQVKLLLNQKRVDDVSRSMAYYRYLTGARLERIGAMTTNLDQQQQVAELIARQQRELEFLKKQKLAEKGRIDEVVGERKHLLTQIDEQLQQSGNRLNRLREDARRLERLVDRIQQENRPPIPPASAATDFGAQRNSLPLPVNGRIVARFGTRKNIGDQRWNGLFIAAPAGENVRGVYAGRVVFSGWLHGYGMLMILDHGDGYMTLYGHNRSLYKGVGDWVETGDVIASVGDTGNPPRTGLYFAVRQSGKPRNPLIWCKVGR
jgi:septal ring factor EnvC (AmiA/AmiB activator)